MIKNKKKRITETITVYTDKKGRQYVMMSDIADTAEFSFKVENIIKDILNKSLQELNK